MALLDRLWRRSPPAPPAPEQRLDEGFASLSRALAEQYDGEPGNLATVAACIGLISTAIAALPVSLTVDTPQGRQPAPPTAPAWRLLTRPNRRQSWPSFMAWMTAQYLSHGNGVARITTDGRGAVTTLTPVPWPWLSPRIVTSVTGDVRLVYDVTNRSDEARLLGLPPRLLDGDVLHVAGRSDAGVIGQSVLSRARSPVREGIEIAKLAEANWRNGMRPSMVYVAPEYLKEPQRAQAKAFLADFHGAINAGKVPLVEGGWKLEQISMNSVDAEFLGSRQFSVAEIARMFAIPEPLLQLGQRTPGDLSVYTTAFGQLCLSPIVAAVEAEFDFAVLPDGMHLQIELDGLMRGSFSAMTAALCAAVQSRILTPNNARESLGWPPHPDGDELAAGTAPSLPADFKGGDHMGQSPGHQGDGPPAPGTNQNEGAGG